MPGLFNSETIWLTLVNVALALAVLVCLIVFGRAVLKELRERAKERKRIESKPTTGNLDLASLGITLPDGGEPLNEQKKSPRKKDAPQDPSQRQQPDT